MAEKFGNMSQVDFLKELAVDSVIPDEMFRKYIDISDGKQGLPTSPQILAEVKYRFFHSHQSSKTKCYEELWNKLCHMVMNNEAFAQFTLDYKGAESEFFFPWIVSVATSPSEALELSYNAGRNIAGEWFDCISARDPINFFVRNLPTLAYNRERQATVARLVEMDRERFGDSRVIDLGAGRMAWARHCGFEFEPTRQKIVACDKDATIDPTKLFPGGELGPSGLVYKKEDITELLKDSSLEDVSLAIMQGVASYYSGDALRELIVRPVGDKLRVGGSFFFDLQLAHISYEWSVKTFHWPAMNLPKIIESAIEIVEKIRGRLWNENMRFGADYRVCTYNSAPLSMKVLLTKLD